jgi:DNA mismatch repair protein MutS2
VKVTVGALTVEVDAAELARGKAAPAARGARPLSGGPPPRVSPEDELALATPSGSNTLDLRGQRADEALDAIEPYLDRAALDGRSPIFIIHGHGTGALRKQVRAYLDRSPYVARWAPGDPRQGGDGVSVVQLR